LNEFEAAPTRHRQDVLAWRPTTLGAWPSFCETFPDVDRKRLTNPHVSGRLSLVVDSVITPGKRRSRSLRLRPSGTLQPCWLGCLTGAPCRLSYSGRSVSKIARLRWSGWFWDFKLSAILAFFLTQDAERDFSECQHGVAWMNSPVSQLEGIALRHTITISKDL
jgi:hypothetical protein